MRNNPVSNVIVAICNMIFIDWLINVVNPVDHL